MNKYIDIINVIDSVQKDMSKETICFLMGNISALVYMDYNAKAITQDEYSDIVMRIVEVLHCNEDSNSQKEK